MRAQWDRAKALWYPLCRIVHWRFQRLVRKSTYLARRFHFETDTGNVNDKTTCQRASDRDRKFVIVEKCESPNFHISQTTSLALQHIE